MKDSNMIIRKNNLNAFELLLFLLPIVTYCDETLYLRNKKIKSGWGGRNSNLQMPAPKADAYPKDA